MTKTAIVFVTRDDALNGYLALTEHLLVHEVRHVPLVEYHVLFIITMTPCDHPYCETLVQLHPLFFKQFLHLTYQVWCILHHGPENLWSLKVSEEKTPSPLVSFQNSHTKWVTKHFKVALLTVSHSISVEEPSQINANTPTWCLGESWGFVSGILKLTIIQWRISSPATIDGRIIVPRSNIMPTHHMFVEAKSEEKSFSSSCLSWTYGWWLVIKERPRSYSQLFRTLIF